MFSSGIGYSLIENAEVYSASEIKFTGFPFEMKQQEC